MNGRMVFAHGEVYAHDAAPSMHSSYHDTVSSMPLSKRPQQEEIAYVDFNEIQNQPMFGKGGLCVPF